METAETKKLTTKDMARAENDRAVFRHDKQEQEQQREAEARDDREQRNPAPSPATNGESPSPLLSADQGKDFRSRWQNVQVGFVDEPRRAVEQADELVAELMQHLARSFSDQRSRLESEWEHSEKVSTEELRLALRRYRSFFDRLLSV